MTDKKPTVPTGTLNLLARHGLKLEASGAKVTVAQLDKVLDAANLTTQRRIAVKFDFQAAGLIDQTS